HGLALAARALGALEQIPLALARRRNRRQRDSLAHRAACARSVGADSVRSNPAAPCAAAITADLACSQKITQTSPNNAWTSRAEAFIVRPMSKLTFTHRLALL